MSANSQQIINLEIFLQLTLNHFFVKGFWIATMYIKAKFSHQNALKS